MPAIKTRTVPSLDKALCILELLTRSRAGLTLPDLVDQSGLAKSSVHYLLVTLERRGYVHRNERAGRYLLGTKLFSLANSALKGLELRQKCAPYLAALRMKTGLTVHLAILEQTEAVLISKHDGQGGPKTATWLGKRMEVHCTGLGKALIAFLPEMEIDTVIQAHGLGRHNENTISTPKRFREELERVARVGYAIDDEEDELGMRCIGVPIFDPDRRAVAAVSVAGTTSEIVAENISYLVTELKRTAARIGAAAAGLFSPARDETRLNDPEPLHLVIAGDVLAASS
jgi:DNA-binding IclR family transcriptional regulator